MSLFVYVIGPADEAGLLKIGRTGNVERRLAQMKGTSPVPLTVLWSRETEDVDLEGKLHRRFADRRRHGEWFDFEGCDWRSLINAAAVELEPALLAHVPQARKASEAREEAPQIWREFQLKDGSPEWTLGPIDPRTSAPRCPCGHKAARHGDNPPHACAGDIPWNVTSCLCECTGFHGTSPWDPESWQAQAFADLEVSAASTFAQEGAPDPLGRPSKRPLAFKRGTPPQEPSQDASKIFSPLRGTR